MTSALIAAALHALIGYAFLTGLAFEVTRASSYSLKLFDVAAPPPALEDAQPAAARTSDPEGAAARPNLKADPTPIVARSEEHTSELQSLMRSSYAVFCLKKKKTIIQLRRQLTTHSI